MFFPGSPNPPRTVPRRITSRIPYFSVQSLLRFSRPGFHFQGFHVLQVIPVRAVCLPSNPKKAGLLDSPKASLSFALRVHAAGGLVKALFPFYLFSFFTSFLSFFLILKLVLAKRAPTMAAFWRLTYTQGVRSNRWLSTDTKMEKFGGMEQANPTDRITEIGRLGPLAVPCPRKIEAVLRPAPATATFPADPHAAVRVVVTGWWIA